MTNKSTGKECHAPNDIDLTTAQSVVDFIEHHHPKFVTIENVKAYRGTDACNIITFALERNGYTFDAEVYDDSFIGGFTRRTRLVIRATTERGAIFPKPKRNRSGLGKWRNLLCDIEDAKHFLGEKTSEHLKRNMKEKPTSHFRYDPSRDCVISTCGNAAMLLPIANTDDFMFPIISTVSPHEAGFHIGGEEYNAIHRFDTARFFFRCHGIEKHYKCATENLAAFICGNGMTRAMVENVMLPFVLQKGSGELSQGLLL